MNTAIVDKSKLFEKGNKVSYLPPHKKDKIFAEHGIVKSVTESGVFVVYHCAGEWENYENYTAALTNPKDLFHGWINPLNL